MAVSLNIEEGYASPPDILADMERLAGEALVRHGLPMDAEVSLTLCGDATIRALNRQWRSIDAPTDVLSFPLLDDGVSDHDGELLVGDIIISLEKAARQADDYGHSLKRELLFLFVHGMLHLLGYDHHDEQERLDMRAEEETLLAVVGAERNEL